MTDFYEDPEWFDFRWEEESGCEEDVIQDVQNLADYLVKKGIPFRDAHEIVAQAVQYAERKGCDLGKLELPELQAFSPQIQADIFTVLTLEGSMQSRNHTGGTAPEQVRIAIQQAKKWLTADPDSSRA